MCGIEDLGRPIPLSKMTFFAWNDLSSRWFKTTEYTASSWVMPDNKRQLAGFGACDTPSVASKEMMERTMSRYMTEPCCGSHGRGSVCRVVGWDGVWCRYCRLLCERIVVAELKICCR